MKNKRIISLVLAILFCFTVTILVATANTKSADIEIVSDKTELQTGESATVSVRVTTNFPVATMSIPIFYDKTLVSVSEAVATLNDYSVENTTVEAQSADYAKIYTNTNISEDDYGFVLVNYIGSAGASVPETIDGEVLTFTITANSNVEGNALINCVSESAKTGNNVAGMLYFGATVNGATIDAIPENVENIDLTVATQTVTITKKSAPNTIAIKESAPYSPVIDTVNKGAFNGTIYGVDTLGCNDDFKVDGTLTDFLTTSYGDEYLEILVGDSGTETTGTVINVLDENREVLETYVFVYFGDVDMDGWVGSSDAFICENFEITYTGFDTVYQFMSGDVEGDGWVGASDAYLMETFEVNGSGMVHQIDISALAHENIYENF